MGASVFALLAVTLAAGIAELLLPGDEGKGTKRFLKMLVALAVLLLLLRPFLGFLDSAESFFNGEVGELSAAETDYKGLLGSAVAKRSRHELSEGLSRYLTENFGIEKEDADIAVTLEADGALRRVSVILSGKALLTDPEAIKVALVDLLHCEVEVR